MRVGRVMLVKSQLPWKFSKYHESKERSTRWCACNFLSRWIRLFRESLGEWQLLVVRIKIFSALLLAILSFCPVFLQGVQHTHHETPVYPVRPRPASPVKSAWCLGRPYKVGCGVPVMSNLPGNGQVVMGLRRVPRSN